MTRRQFLGCAAAVSLPRWRVTSLTPLVRVSPGISIIDLGRECSLRESISGYAAAMEGRARVTDVSSLVPCAVLIVPAAVAIPFEAITVSLEAGGLVILESGAGFTNAPDRSRHRAVLRDAFHVQVGPPIDLWPRAFGSQIPYVDFTWPVAAKVRDFSRVVPLASGAGEVIAEVNGLPVALRRRSGRGTLIVLGSPLGPALWAGDAEAKRWLSAVLPGHTEREHGARAVCLAGAQNGRWEVRVIG